MIEPVIDHSLSLLPGRAASGDVAHGILAAIRRVREALDEMGGYALVALLDEAVRDRLIVRNLRIRRSGGAVVCAELPLPGPAIGVAETIMVAAAEACLIYAADPPDLVGALSVVLVLVDRLIETLGEAPSHGDLAAWLRNGEELDIGTFDELPFGAAQISVH